MTEDKLGLHKRLGNFTFRKRDWVALILLLLVALVLRLNFRQASISGSSMEPTYHNGDSILVWKSYPRSLLKPGDVIVFKDRKNGDELIKRIAFFRDPALTTLPPGEYVMPNGGRKISYALLFGYYFGTIRAHHKNTPPADSTIYVLGDNLMVSDDSRHFGPISPTQILGKAIP